MKTVLPAVAIVVAFVVGLPAAPQRFDLMMADDLYAAYLVSGPVVLTNAFPDNRRFEIFRADFRKRVLTAWEAGARDPKRAMFMLDVSLATEGKTFLYWSDFLLLGQTYLRSRVLPPGSDARMDAFELLWHKTALAYLEGRRQPELVEQLARGLTVRIAAQTPPPTGAAVFVDPWIELLKGFVHEGYVIANAERFKSHIAPALEAYSAATNYDATRAEAIVRGASLLLRSNRAAEALAALERFEDGSTRDRVLIYWAWLLKGKALDALERPDESIAAYARAQQIVPSAQSPVVGAMMAESRRGRDADAEAFAVQIRTAPEPIDDPWWIYPHGDLRFFQQRLAALREMVR